MVINGGNYEECVRTEWAAAVSHFLLVWLVLLVGAEKAETLFRVAPASNVRLV